MKLVVVVLLLLSSVAQAGDLEWSGTYRVEGVKVDKPEMGASERNKQYILHHLVLTPKINVFDGVTIYTRFDVMNSSAYPHSQVGQFFGSPVNSTGGAGTPGAINALSENQASDMIEVNHLYLTYAHEFGLLTVGRAPIHFGLGMSYNGGFGAFDHWFDNRDMLAYKMVMGNLSFMPVIAKIAENDPGFSDDIDDYMVQVQYENPETDLKLGLLYRRRHAGNFGNDIPGAPIFGAPGTTAADRRMKSEYWNVFISRYIGESFKLGIEGGVQKGDLGVLSNGSEVRADGFGVAVEMDYAPKTANWALSLKTGVASGDDPSTPDLYEGYMFDRNYDVAFLLFNHPMGSFDMFRTGAIRDTTVTASRTVDTETVSNVIYISPSAKYKWNEKLDSQIGLTYAQLDRDPLGTGVGKSVGIEVDLTMTYKPYDGFQWVNRLGVFSPGEAFEGGSNQLTTKTVMGLETKAAITF